MNLDLDEMEVSLGYLDDWKQLIKELRAAREVVQCVKDVYSGKYLTGASDKWKSLIEKYDEARRG